MISLLQSIVTNWFDESRRPRMVYGSLGAVLAFMVVLYFISKVPVSYNVRNLAVRWKTTLMTALAFTLVVALMTVMMAFVNGMYTMIQSSSQPGNVVVLASGSNDESFSNLAFDDVSTVDSEAGIVTDADGDLMVTKEIYVIANQQIPVAKGQPSRRRFVQIRGIENPVIAGKVHGLTLKAGGQWFSDAGVEEGPGGDAGGARALIQCVIGSGLAGELGSDRPGGKPLAVSETFELADRTWKVTGILDSAGSTFDSELWAKRTLAGEKFGKTTSYSSLLVRAAGPDEATELADQFKESKKTALNSMTEKQYYSSMGETSKQFLYAIIVVAVVMGIGGVFGVMNTMFAAISQRRQDIGVLRILGYQRRYVLVSFLLESMVIALIGGLLGCGLGTLADGWTARSIVSSGFGGKLVVLHLAVSADILGAGLLLSLFMGALGGFVPAVTAMRLRALESLR